MIFTGKRVIIIKPSGKTENKIVGVDDNEGPPVPIPNTEVKLVDVENTWLATARDDRKMPTPKTVILLDDRFFYVYIMINPQNILMLSYKI